METETIGLNEETTTMKMEITVVEAIGRKMVGDTEETGMVEGIKEIGTEEGIRGIEREETSIRGIEIEIISEEDMGAIGTTEAEIKMFKRQRWK